MGAATDDKTTCAGVGPVAVFCERRALCSLTLLRRELGCGIGVLVTSSAL